MDRKHMMAAMAMRAATRAPRSPLATAIPGLTIWCSREPTGPVPALFEPKFYILLQGAKRLTIAGGARAFGPGDCAVSSVGLPFTSEVTAASATEPYIGVELELDAADLGVIANLVRETRGSEPVPREEAASAFMAARADLRLLEPLDRLLRLLADPLDIPVLARSYKRELCYRLLQGPLGSALARVVQKNTRFDQVRSALDWICANADQPMCVERLATSVGMSVTSFHRHFKAVTAYSPLAYQRHIRLLEAQRLIASGATNVTTAAFRSGYASSSQFSREYKRMFGVAPRRDALSLR